MRVVLNSARKTVGHAAPSSSHARGYAIGTRKTIRIERPDGPPYYRYACMCHRCKIARDHLPKTEEPEPRPEVSARAVSAFSRKMNAAKTAKYGGATGGGSKRRIEHVKGLPIGSTLSTPGEGYVCRCLECRIARGHYKPKKAQRA